MPAALDIDQLRTFIAIAETGSFTQAAGLVYKTQSAVSMQMRRLEERLGTTLFTRAGRNSVLTNQGKSLLEKARQLVELNDSTMASFNGETLSGAIRLCLPDDYADCILPSVLATFARIYPNVTIEISCQMSDETAAGIAEGRYDFGFVTLDGANYDAVPLRSEPVHWVASREHFCQDLTDSSKPVALAMGPDDCSCSAAAHQLLKTSARPFKVVYRSSSAAALNGAVLSGLAVALMPESAIRPGMRLLTEGDGFPKPPPLTVGLMRSKVAQGPAYDAMMRHIQISLGNLTDADRAA